MGNAEALKDLTVISLEASNFMRLKAIKLVPDPDDPLVLITGANGVGKTTVINTVWCALGGEGIVSDIAPGSPVSDGAEEAEIVLNLGDIVVRRKFRTTEVKDDDGNVTGRVYKDSGLVVTNAEGSLTYNSPQTLLNELLGRFTLDLTTFLDAAPKDQLDTAIELAGLTDELAVLDARRLELYVKRTEVNAARDSAKAAADEIDAPNERPEVAGVSELLEKRSVREEQHREAVSAENAKRRAIEEARQAVRVAESTRSEADARVATADANVEELQRQLDVAEKELISAETSLTTCKQQFTDATNALHKLPSAELVPDPDYSDLDAQISGADEARQAARAFDDRAAKLQVHATQAAASKALTDEINGVDEKKRALVAGADLKVPGLGFGEDGLTWVGEDGAEHPLAQEGTGVKLRVAMAVAMTEDSGIKVIRIDDGERFDRANLALIREMAAANGYQVWMARVDETGEVGFVIEDGELAA